MLSIVQEDKSVQAEKVKKSRPRQKQLRFIVLWLIGNALAWMPYFFFEETRMFNLPEQLKIGFVLGGAISIVQYLLIRWQFKLNLKWWIPASTLASLIGAFIIVTLLWSGAFNQLNLTLIGLMLFTLPTIPQAFMLYKHLRQAWLWVLSSVASTTVFAMTLIMLDGGMIEAATSFAVSAIVMSMTLLWLFGMSQSSDKFKNIANAENRLSNSEKLSESQNTDDEVQQQSQGENDNAS